MTIPGPARTPLRHLRRALPILLALVLLGLGIALGEALHDNPQPGGTQSRVRTLRPLPLAPAARSTVTRTVRTR